MTDPELISYFETAELPDTLRIDRATTQHEVKAAVKRNIEWMLRGSKEGGARHRLLQIHHALENPYNGSEIPRY